MEKEILENFSQLKSKASVQSFYEKALNIITSALNNINNTKNLTNLSYNETRIFPIGDYTNDTFIDQEGGLEIVIANSNPQLRLANQTFVKNIKNARTKKQMKEISNRGTLDEFIFNFLNVLAQFFDESSILIVVEEGIKVLCYEEYGFKLTIRFATYTVDDEYAILDFWNPIKKCSSKVNLFSYNDAIAKKDKETNGNYKKLVRIFKNIRKTILMNKWAASGDINKYFVELMVYNIPNSLMQDKDVVLLVTKSFNYLDNCNLLNFKTFDGKSIENFDMAKITYYKMKKFIMYLRKVLY